VPKVDFSDIQVLEQLIRLEKAQQLAVLKTMRKLMQLTWQQVYRDSGLNWEAVGNGDYTIRINLKIRALVHRVGDYVQFVSLHPDHDSAYE
jgi:hypothetical protein